MRRDGKKGGFQPLKDLASWITRGKRDAAGRIVPDGGDPEANMGGILRTGNMDAMAYRVSDPPPALADPENVPATIQPKDLKTRPKPLTKEQRALVEKVKRLAREAHESRAERERTWQLCRRYEMGEQWLVVDPSAGVIDPRDDDEADRCYTLNMLRPITRKVTALATQNRPDVNFVPMTEAPMDVQASEQAAAWGAHCYREVNFDQLLKDCVRECLRSTTCYLVPEWLPQALALLPQYGPDGKLSGAYSYPAGAAGCTVVPSDFVLWDPSSATIRDAEWVIHEDIRPLSWFQRTFGAEGYAVEPDADSLTSSYTGETDDETGRMFFGGRYKQGGDRKCLAARCLRWYVLPNGLYPEGRCVIIAGGRVLWNGPWPYDKCDEHFFVPIQWEAAWQSPYGDSLVQELVDAQTIINKELSRILARLDADKRVILIQKLSAVGADAYDETRDLMKVYYEVGSAAPQIQNIQSVNADHFTLLMMAFDKLKEISGIVDVLSGKPPQGVTAGISLELLQQSAQSMLLPLLTSIEAAVTKVFEWWISYGEQFVREDRLFGVDMMGNPAETDGIQEPQDVQQGGMGQGMMPMPAVPQGMQIPPIPNGPPAPLNGIPMDGLQPPTDPFGAMMQPAGMV